MEISNISLYGIITMKRSLIQPRSVKIYNAKISKVVFCFKQLFLSMIHKKMVLFFPKSLLFRNTDMYVTT